MNILMMTNTYKPLLGGLEKSVEYFSEEFRQRGHRVVIVTPEYEGAPASEKDIIRIPAVQRFNGSDFSVQLPIPGGLAEALGSFKPHIVHSHHPFFIGDTALRVAARYNVPLVFTHHSLYEENVHYLPGNEQALKQFVIALSTGYANLADQVFAPSISVAKLIKERGVETPIEVIPTGLRVNEFSRGAGRAFRKKQGIPADAFVVGHLGRLAPEKNMEFLTRAVTLFVRKHPQAYFLLLGSGPSEAVIKEIAAKEGVSERLRMAGTVEGKEKTAAYHAMDVFAFASQSETQGLVLTEAFAAKVPIVAVDACGVRDVVEDKINGRLLEKEDADAFVAALDWIKERSGPERTKIRQACRKTAGQFQMDKIVENALAAYTSLSVRHGFIRRAVGDSKWSKTRRLIQAEFGLVRNLTKAARRLVSVTLQG